jgi:hypothetical protein
MDRFFESPASFYHYYAQMRVVANGMTPFSSLTFVENVHINPVTVGSLRRIRGQSSSSANGNSYHTPSGSWYDLPACFDDDVIVIAVAIFCHRHFDFSSSGNRVTPR